MGRLGSRGIMAQPSCQPDGPPWGSDLVRVAVETPRCRQWYDVKSEVAWHQAGDVPTNQLVPVPPS